MGPDSIIFRILVLRLVYMCHRRSSDVRGRYQITGMLGEVRMTGTENSLCDGKGGQ